MLRIFIIFTIFLPLWSNNVKSTNGVLNFDRNSDGSAEMVLNSTGLGIGVVPSTNLHVAGNAIFTENFVIGDTTGSSNLELNGSIGYGFQSLSANATLGAYSTVMVDSSSENIILDLPYAGNVTGRIYSIKKISESNSVWITGGGNLLDDTNPIELGGSSLASVEVISNGVQWYIINSKDLSNTVAASNLVGWWKFDETSSAGGIAADASGQGNDGTMTNLAAGNIGVTGKIKSAIDFDNSDDYIDLDNQAQGSSLDLTDRLSFSFWVKGNSGDQQSGILARDDGVDRQYNIHTYEGNPKVFLDGVAVTGSTNIVDNNWHHVAATWDKDHPGNNLLLYVNGVEEASASKAAAMTSYAEPVYIGRRISAYWLGLIDDFRIYNRALTPAEISAIYNEGH